MAGSAKHSHWLYFVLWLCVPDTSTFYDLYGDLVGGKYGQAISLVVFGSASVRTGYFSMFCRETWSVGGLDKPFRWLYLVQLASQQD